MAYRIETGMFGKRTVHYPCERCGQELESPFETAGSIDHCPFCGHTFICPGADALNAEREAELKKERQATVDAAEAKRRREVDAILARPAPPPLPPPPVMVWYGDMYCRNCGYSWKARRSTPPARCAGCSSKNIQTVEVPQRASVGCLVILLPLLFSLLWMVSAAKGWRWG